MEATRLLKRRPWGIAGAVILLAVTLITILSFVIAPHGVNEIDIGARLQPPGGDYLLGTDNLGRDIFSRLLYGSRVYVAMGLIATGIAAILGIILALLSAGVRGKTDSVLRVGIVILAIPALIILALMVMVSLQVPLLNSFLLLSILLSFILLPSVYLVIRKAFITATGKERFKTIWQELWLLIPVNLGVAIGVAVLIIAPMGYRGVLPPPFIDWGSMLSSAGPRSMLQAPWIWQAPAIAIVITVLGLVLFALSLREIWFPRFPESLATGSP